MPVHARHGSGEVIDLLWDICWRHCPPFWLDSHKVTRFQHRNWLLENRKRRRPNSSVKLLQGLPPFGWRTILNVFPFRDSTFMVVLVLSILPMFCFTLQSKQDLYQWKILRSNDVAFLENLWKESLTSMTTDLIVAYTLLWHLAIDEMLCQCPLFLCSDLEAQRSRYLTSFYATRG